MPTRSGDKRVFFPCPACGGTLESQKWKGPNLVYCLACDFDGIYDADPKALGLFDHKEYSLALAGVPNLRAKIKERRK